MKREYISSPSASTESKTNTFSLLLSFEPELNISSGDETDILPISIPNKSSIELLKLFLVAKPFDGIDDDDESKIPPSPPKSKSSKSPIPVDDGFTFTIISASSCSALILKPKK